jgi:hypothetical protein
VDGIGRRATMLPSVAARINVAAGWLRTIFCMVWFGVRFNLFNVASLICAIPKRSLAEVGGKLDCAVNQVLDAGSTRT